MSLAVPPVETPDWHRKAASAINSCLSRRTDVPASATAPGQAGQIAFDASFAYFCVSDGQWLRVALATW